MWNDRQSCSDLSLKSTSGTWGSVATLLLTILYEVGNLPRQAPRLGNRQGLGGGSQHRTRVTGIVLWAPPGILSPPISLVSVAFSKVVSLSPIRPIRTSKVTPSRALSSIIPKVKHFSHLLQWKVSGRALIGPPLSHSVGPRIRHSDWPSPSPMSVAGQGEVKLRN